jgi:hypothetical protein
MTMTTTAPSHAVMPYWTDHRPDGSTASRAAVAHPIWGQITATLSTRAVRSLRNSP